MLIVRLDEAFTDTSLDVLKRDALLEGDNGGVTFLADFSKDLTWPGASAPVNGDAIGSLTETNDAIMAVPSAAGAEVVTLAGNGIDFTGVDQNRCCVEVPSAVLADIWGTGAENHYFMVCGYYKLPAQADWNASGTIGPIADSETVYSSGGQLAMMAMNSGGQIGFRRQTNGATVDNLGGTTPSAYNALAQVAFWRNASGQGGRVKMAAGTTSVSAAVGSNNVTNFSAKKYQFGITGTFWLSSGIAAGAVKFKFYRGFIENLRTSGRDPTTVLDADWARVVASGRFT